MCLNPLKRYQIGYTSNGKPNYLIRSRQTDFIYKVGNIWHDGFDGGAKVPYGAEIVRDGLLTPCGQCIECRLAKSREWATRMVLEQQYHDSSYFVTLTYDNEHVPVSYYPDPDTGEAMPSLTLRKADLPPFFKRLRAKLDYAGRPPIRFYACGEYGDETHRPHYHAIIFGLELDDLKLIGHNWRGEKYYTSDFVRSCWPYGNILVADVTFDSAAYVARYCTKKWTGDWREFYETFNLEPEFSLMSRRPGIGRQYYEDYKDDIYDHDEIHLTLGTGGKCVRPPRYYDGLYDGEHPLIMADIKDRRIADADAREVIRKGQSTLSDEEVLQAQRDLYAKRYRMLKREEI